MICKLCKQEGETSRLFSDGSMVTLIAFSSYWDEQGRKHSHNPNKYTTGYHCSRGHRYGEVSLEVCPSCDYGGVVG